MLQADTVIWDLHEHFEKMTFRNRYHIAGASGLLKMSIPIEGGREHKSAMGETRIANHDKWQQQHWRTIVSAYRRAPYFEYYEASLEKLFNTPFGKLADFNLASVHWLKQQLRCTFKEEVTLAYQKTYPDAAFDARQSLVLSENPQVYTQVFQDRTGFIPNLSLLDLLFAEGPYSLAWLERRK